MLATPLQSSVAVAVPVADGSVESEQSTVIFGGVWMTGAVVSCTVTTFVHVLVQPPLFVTVSVKVNEPLVQSPAFTVTV